MTQNLENQNENQPVKNEKKSKRPWLLVAIIAAILLCLFIVGIIPRISRSNKNDRIANETSLPNVVLLSLTPNDKPIELILPSSAQALYFTPIWARVNGYLLRYLVDIGDRVKLGDLLAEIDTPEADEQLAQAKAELLNSISERDIAKITSDRWQALYDKNREAISRQEVDQYNANLKSAEAIVIANRKNVSRLTYQQQFKFIYAPFDGIITKRNTEQGALIYGSVNGTPQELFEIAKIHTIRFFIDVPQTYFREIKDNIDAEVTVLEFPGKVFKGYINRFANALDPQSRTMRTEVRVENPDNILYPGLFGRVKFFIIPSNLNFIIPTTAVIIRSGPPQVAVVDDNNIVHLVNVQIGRDYGNQMQITNGLKQTDRIVKLPNDRIREGAKVNVITQ